jgi:hypothetical protein
MISTMHLVLSVIARTMLEPASECRMQKGAEGYVHLPGPAGSTRSVHEDEGGDTHPWREHHPGQFLIGRRGDGVYRATMRERPIARRCRMGQLTFGFRTIVLGMWRYVDALCSRTDPFSPSETKFPPIPCGTVAHRSSWPSIPNG